MTQYAIVTDLNRCVGCLGCSVACKVLNGVPVGSYWNKVLRVGPFPTKEGATYPDVYTYWLPLQCQHCKNPECVKVCPTGASMKLADGTVQIDKSKCIGCQFCVMACPYGVRYLNEDEGVVEKCTLCEQKLAEGELPQCVAQCGARARFFGDLDEGIGNLKGAGKVAIGGDTSYEATMNTFCTLDEVVDPYSEGDIHHLTDVGNGPAVAYILRNGMWKGQE
ncbi:4Fe-4S dicluster domain-containing protein [Xiamenia xianingshaonis]|uniref:4Fe-4S dicluster domain-containing protein n=1 Tax=Xiamenia xianingshaonis TaxID=2682776 RepID=A0ABX0IHZ7_9ACTN|nr:4Fe-4S dicluster domain-containing protein [Xiamenia xianingshaonis]NGM16730.1 4Fe-4S dicluster domain-containing protein [Eggerthellaceae bacterium zg-893]NHM13574.1 4Fe-4S dicluster domain-containing protein [Xiamenia xianingshaonis]NHM16553.1 4Fe-4S dicluster domain-containing protein [Xiamenia xianingshaonis]